MDNLGDWLYIIILVVGAIGSLFSNDKKKKSREILGQPENGKKKTAVPANRRIKDIFEEVFQKELDEYFPPEEKEKTPCSRKKSTAAKPSAQQQPIINPNIETAISRNNISLQEGTVFQGTIDIPENNPATPSPYAEIFNNPDSVRQAFICSEILNRKYQ